jgi:hypothetical protein
MVAKGGKSRDHPLLEGRVNVANHFGPVRETDVPIKNDNENAIRMY